MIQEVNVMAKMKKGFDTSYKDRSGRFNIPVKKTPPNKLVKIKGEMLVMPSGNAGRFKTSK